MKSVSRYQVLIDLLAKKQDKYVVCCVPAPFSCHK